MMKIQSITQSSQTLLTESCQGLTRSQRRIVEGIYRDLQPLVEASLSQQQISQLFTGVEQAATASGNNRTMIGRGVDVARTVNQTINKVGQWLQNTAPVAAFDQKFENLKGTISQKFPELSQSVSKLGAWATANPGKTAAIIGVLTTIAALGAGPAGGAIAGQILRGTVELLRGEKLSTAVGKGAKTAAYGALAGFGLDKIGDMLGGGLRMTADTLFPGARRLNLSFDGTGTFQYLSDVIGTSKDIESINTIWQQATKAWDNGQYDAAAALFQQAKNAAAKLADPAYVAQLSQDQNAHTAILNGAKSLMSVTDALSAAAQGAVTGATGAGGKQPTAEALDVMSIMRQIPLRKIPREQLINRDATIMAWTLNESLGQNRGGVHLTDLGVATIFENLARIRSVLLEADAPGALTDFGTVGAKRAAQRQAADVGRAYQSSLDAAKQYQTGASQAAAPAAAPAAKQPGFLSRAWGGVKSALSQSGTNLTTKITADKLMSAWKKAGSPTDSNELAAFLEKQQVPQAVVSQVYQGMNIPMPAGSAQPTAAAPAGSAAARGIALAWQSRAKELTSPSPEPTAAPAASTPAAADTKMTVGAINKAIRSGKIRRRDLESIQTTVTTAIAKLPSRGATARVKAPNMQVQQGGSETVSIGGQKLNPKNPKDAEIIAKARAASK